MKNLIKKVLKEHSEIDITQFKDEIFDLPLDERRALQRGLETIVTVKNKENLEEQINYKGIPEMRATTTLGKLAEDYQF